MLNNVLFSFETLVKRVNTEPYIQSFERITIYITIKQKYFEFMKHLTMHIAVFKHLHRTRRKSAAEK